MKDEMLDSQIYLRRIFFLVRLITVSIEAFGWIFRDSSSVTFVTFRRPYPSNGRNGKMA